jgi:acyl-CoA thioesterase I
MKVRALLLMLAISCVTVAAAPRTILVLGDSIAAGYGLDPDEAFPAVLEVKIQKAGLDYKVINAGLTGDTSAGGLRRINWLLRQPIDLLLLELGGNDGLRGISPDETLRNLGQIIVKVREKNPAARIVIAGMQMPNNMGEEYTSRFRSIFPTLAKEHKATLIPFLLEGVGAKPELNQPDRIHPTAEGHRMIAETVWKFVRPLVEALAASPMVE